MPSGSLANQIGMRLHVAPGEEVIADSLAHVLRAEMGAAAVFSGITSRSWAAPRGLLDPAAPLALMQPDAGAYQVSTRLVVVENTHNFGGGTIQPLAAIRELRAATRARGVAMHLDGARLWNAHVATGTALSAYGQEFDTVSVCLSKGLGAPVGSVLVGSAEAMAGARIWRKRYGGGMRQAGILAAGGLWALEHHLDRLADDHARARSVAQAVAKVAPEVVDPDRVETNIVILDVGAAGWTAAQFVAAADERGVRMYATDARSVRMVWHLDVDDADTVYAADVVSAMICPWGPWIVTSGPGGARPMPSGQRRSESLRPVNYGRVPHVDLATWSLTIAGDTLTGEVTTVSWEEFAALPRVDVRADHHCVSRYTTQDLTWSGVAARTIIDLAPPADDIEHVLVSATYGYSSNIALSDLASPRAVFATHLDGEPLTPEHGWPVRLVLPHLYGWKGPKWVRSIDYRRHPERGFWEQRGYHFTGDAWREERYSYQEYGRGTHLTCGVSGQFLRPALIPLTGVGGRGRIWTARGMAAYWHCGPLSHRVWIPC